MTCFVEQLFCQNKLAGRDQHFGNQHPEKRCLQLPRALAVAINDHHKLGNVDNPVLGFHGAPEHKQIPNVVPLHDLVLLAQLCESSNGSLKRDQV